MAFTHSPAGRGLSGNSRGATAVELALVLPVLLLFLFGIIELGNLIRIQITLKNAAEVGARTAITGEGALDGTRMAVITNATQNALAAIPAPAPSITISAFPGNNPAATPLAGNAGDACQLMEVRLDYTYQPITPLVGPLLGEVPLSLFERKVNEPWVPCD